MNGFLSMSVASFMLAKSFKAVLQVWSKATNEHLMT
jgi:hypothetical protein